MNLKNGKFDLKGGRAMKGKKIDIMLQDNLSELEVEELENTVGGDAFFKIIVTNVCQEFKDIFKYFDK
jgi:hypothetical protein